MHALAELPNCIPPLVLAPRTLMALATLWELVHTVAVTTYTAGLVKRTPQCWRHALLDWSCCSVHWERV